MKQVEYSNTAIFMFKMAIQILTSLNNVYKQLDEATYCQRKIEKKVVRYGTDTKEYSVIPLTREEITHKVKESGYNSIIKTVSLGLIPLYSREASIDWIKRYVDKYYVYHPELKHIFINCQFNRDMDSFKVRELVLYLIIAMNECIRNGIDEDEESNKMVSFIAKNADKVLDYFYSECPARDL